MKRAGFTLLELIVVIAILAIIAGGLLVAYSGLEDRAGSSQAAHSMKALGSAVQTYAIMESGFPNDMDSLITATGTFPTGGSGLAGDSTDPVTAGRFVSTLDEHVTEELLALALPASVAGELNEAGIFSLRYIDPKGDGAGGDLDAIALATGGRAGDIGTIGDIENVAIPGDIFNSPTLDEDGNNVENIGRGFSAAIGAGSIVAQINPGANGSHNVKLGGAPTDVIIAVGIGNSSSIVGPNASGRVARIAEAPSYANTHHPEMYNRYILLLKIGNYLTAPATAPIAAADFAGGDAEASEVEFIGVIGPHGEGATRELAAGTTGS